MTKNKIYLASIIVVFTILAACSDRKPSILIIGDSISIGYTPFVENQFSDKAIISHNPGNAQHTGTGLEKIDEWLGEEKWDIIHFNWGLWDLCYRHPDSEVQGHRDKINGEITYNIDDYASNLDSIVKSIKNKSNARLIFVTTTFVPDNEAGRYKEDVIRYNEVAKQIMIENDILVNDIYEKSISIHNSFRKDTNDVHYLQEGYKKLGKLVSEYLEQEIKTLD